jgi:hypothetical protein
VTTITLDDVIAQQQRLAAMIEALQTHAREQHVLIVAEAAIELRPGERYAGLLLGDDGMPSHHLVLLPHKPDEDLAWADAKAWAERVGGELPTRREQSLLFANLKGEFDDVYYWSGEEHTNGSFAWCQSFYGGYQSYDHKAGTLRCRAVRRVNA